MSTQVDFMETGKALEIVFYMARASFDREKISMDQAFQDQYQLALDTVEDFIVSNFGEN